jgi:hypothetical protein
VYPRVRLDRLDDVEKRKYLTLPGLELRLLGRSQPLYGLRYPGSEYKRTEGIMEEMQAEEDGRLVIRVLAWRARVSDCFKRTNLKMFRIRYNEL